MEFIGDESEDTSINGVQIELNLDTMFINNSDRSYEQVLSNARMSRLDRWWAI